MSGLYTCSMNCHHYVRYFWHAYRRSALCWILLYIINSFKLTTDSYKQPSFRDIRYLTEVPSTWIFSHRMGCLAGVAEHTRTESQASGGGGQFPIGWGSQRGFQLELRRRDPAINHLIKIGRASCRERV